MERLSLLPRISLSALGLFMLVGACGGDDDTSQTVQIRNFCAGYASASTFSCCSPDDRSNPIFAQRYRYGTQGVCADALSNLAAQANGRIGFNQTAADSCLAYLNSRPCGAVPFENVVREEQEAGCSRVLVGVQKEGQNCNSSEECEAGLVCPTLKETGLSFCTKPAGSNQDCIGAQAVSIDHPACSEGLSCSFIGVNPAGCPSPPCNIFKCVPPFEENDFCSGNECAPNLTCKEADPAGAPGVFSCLQGGKATAGQGCKVPEHCAEGLYCDAATGSCVARKSDGESCDPGNNRAFECKGVCTGSGGSGTCARFCGQ